MPRVLPIAFLAGCLLTGPFLGRASAVSVDELFNLKANGLSDDILVALIEADGSVFYLSADDVLALHRKGLSEKVILAMLATARAALAAAERQALLEPAPEAEPVVPVTVQAAANPAPIEQSIVQHVEVVPQDPVYVHVPVAFPVAVAVPVRHEKPVEPVYWGFGGRLRSDSWQPRSDASHTAIDRAAPHKSRR